MVRVAAPGGLSNGCRVVAVGTGTCAPRLRRGGPCTLLEVDGCRCVVDLGLGALHGLLRAGVDPGIVDAVLLTHPHPDHLAELPALLFAANYGQPRRTRPLRLVASAATLEAAHRVSAAHGHWLEPAGYSLARAPLEPGDERTLGPLRLQAGAVCHHPASLAYRFEIGNTRVVVAGDTGPSVELEALARGADLLLLEASLAPGDDSPGHLTAAQAGVLARGAGAAHLALVHLYPAADAGDPGAEAAATFGGPVTVAEDGMEWEL